MTAHIENYAMIGDTQAAALVDRTGSIDWMCLPRFDSGACFAALLGDRTNGRWRLSPKGALRGVRRRYRPDTLVLETELETDRGAVRLIDFMPVRGEEPDVVRIVEGVSGRVTMELDLVVRFDYGRVLPWVRRRDDALTMVAGPDALCLRGDVDVRGEDLSTVAEFEIAAGERRSMVLTWFPSHRPLPAAVDPFEALRETEAWWRAWSAKCTYEGPWREAVGTSLRVLKALTFGPTGGIVAAPTTSLPESPGGARNWDYRYCWLRDATLTLYALMLAGYEDESIAWREEIALPNGARLLLQPNKQLPNLHLRLALAGGPVFEPANRRGLTSLMATLLSKDTARRSAEEVARAIEETGGVFEERRPLAW